MQVDNVTSIIKEVRLLREDEREGKLCCQFPSVVSNARCGRQAIWELHELYETLIIRDEKQTPASYDLKTYYCEKHGAR